jgi:hypothetical protein
VPDPTPPGGCFVVLAGDGRYWAGDGWVDSWHDARQFRRPPLLDPWLTCQDLCVRLRETFGIYCVPAYVAAAEVRAG